MVKGDDHAINSAYLVGQCLGPLKVGPYYARHVKTEQVSAPKRLTLSPYKVRERRMKEKLSELAVEVKILLCKTH